MDRLLIVGFGDIARRALAPLERRFEVARLSRSHGADLDRPETLAVEGADALLHCAPPPNAGDSDTRTANLLTALEEGRILPARLVYVSTSGVYGDCAGACVDESRPLAPQTQRARRRVDAERRLAQWCRSHGIALLVLRAPGIYAADRLPLERLRAGTPVLRPEDDVYTSHIHAEDLAAIVCRALQDDAPAGIYNASDDSEIRMGDWFDLIADAHGLPRPPRIARAEASRKIPSGLLSFMGESRRLDNRKLKRTLGIELRYPTVREGLHEHAAGIDQSA
jgi:nucleoside-diphosphate-sugar epimerase